MPRDDPHPVSTFRAPPFAPRIWVEGDDVIMLFRDGQAIRVPLAEPRRLFMYLRHEQRRHAVRNPGEDWLTHWSLAQQQKMDAIRAEQERRADAEAIRQSKLAAKAKRQRDRAAAKRDAYELLAELGL